MTTKTAPKAKRLTEKDVDAMVERILADHGAAIHEARSEDHLDPDANAAKWEEVEALLTEHQFTEFVPGWVLEGWTVKADVNAASLRPLIANMMFRSTTKAGYDEAYEWALDTGGQAVYQRLDDIGFPLGEVEAKLN
ncbi:hypothetical protein [Citricoccus nitrophenolicus]|uniref:hypothetical protein n=1 Tax=Citricoccus nitrophenolicus TaxID=863575 RepID=UPI0031EFA1F7